MDKDTREQLVALATTGATDDGPELKAIRTLALALLKVFDAVNEIKGKLRDH